LAKEPTEKSTRFEEDCRSGRGEGAEAKNLHCSRGVKTAYLKTSLTRKKILTRSRWEKKPCGGGEPSWRRRGEGSRVFGEKLSLKGGVVELKKRGEVRQ